jgi:hypothetical protein
MAVTDGARGVWHAPANFGLSPILDEYIVLIHANGSRVVVDGNEVDCTSVPGRCGGALVPADGHSASV